MEQFKDVRTPDFKDMLKVNRFNLQFFAEDNDQDNDQTDDIQDDDQKDDQNDDQDDDLDNVEFTPAQQKKMNQIIAKRVKDEQKQKEKAVKEAEKLSKMNAQQKQEYELQKERDRASELEARLNRYEMSKEASKMLSAKNIQVSDELLETVTRETAEETKSTVEAFISVVNSEVQKQVNEKLKGSTPSGSTDSSNGYMSLRDIHEKIKDPSERTKLIQKYHMN